MWPTNYFTQIKFTCPSRNMFEWLEHRDCDRHGLGSKPTQAILLCSWERHLTALCPTW